MAALLPPLEQISQQHPEPVIQGLASDLRATIATHGAYRSESVPRAASQHRPAQTAGHSSNIHPAKTSSSKPHTNSTSIKKLNVPGQLTSTYSHNSEDTSVSRVRTPPVSHSKHPTVPAEAPKVSTHSTEPKSVHAVKQTAKGITEESVPPSEVFSECLLEACDPDVPTRAVALRSLTRFCKDGDKVALQNKDRLLTVSLSYIQVYLYAYVFV